MGHPVCQSSLSLPEGRVNRTNRGGGSGQGVVLYGPGHGPRPLFGLARARAVIETGGGTAHSAPARCGGASDGDRRAGAPRARSPGTAPRYGPCPMQADQVPSPRRPPGSAPDQGAGRRGVLPERNRRGRHRHPALGPGPANQAPHAATWGRPCGRGRSFGVARGNDLPTCSAVTVRVTPVMLGAAVWARTAASARPCVGEVVEPVRTRLDRLRRENEGAVVVDADGPGRRAGNERVPNVRADDARSDRCARRCDGGRACPRRGFRGSAP